MHAAKVLAGRVKLISPKEKEMWRELGLVYRRDRTLTQAARTFIICAPTGGHLDEAHRMPKRSALRFTR